MQEWEEWNGGFGMKFQRVGMWVIGAAIGCIVGMFLLKFMIWEFMHAKGLEKYKPLVSIAIILISALVHSMLHAHFCKNCLHIVVPKLGSFLATNALGVFFKRFDIAGIFTGCKLPLDPFMRVRSLDDLQVRGNQVVDDANHVITNLNPTTFEDFKAAVANNWKGYLVLLIIFLTLSTIGIVLQKRHHAKKKIEKAKKEHQKQKLNGKEAGKRDSSQWAQIKKND